MKVAHIAQIQSVWVAGKGRRFNVDFSQAEPTKMADIRVYIRTVLARAQHANIQNTWVVDLNIDQATIIANGINRRFGNFATYAGQLA